MYKKVVQYIEKYQMIQKGESVIVGISGGADSVCLFYLLLQYMKALHGEAYSNYLYGVHVQHGIRGAEALQDMEYVQRLLANEKIICYTRTYDVPAYALEQHLTVEEAGRVLRYQTFQEVAARLEQERQQSVKIAVAHHENDNAETVLYNLCRGTGLKGLCGIPAVNGAIIRPLLCVNRTEIELYLQERGITYQTDSTNLEVEYTRNRLRMEILPLLTERINEQTVSHIAMAADDAEAAEQYLERVTLEQYQKIVMACENQLLINITQLQKLDKYLAKRVIRLCIASLCGSLKDITRKHIDAIYLLMDKQTGKSLQLPRGITAVIAYENCVLCRENTKPEGYQSVEKKQERDLQETELQITKPGLYMFGRKMLKFEISEIIFETETEIIKFLENEIKNTKNVYTKYFDYDKMKFTLCIRNRKPGDKLAIDSENRHKKLKSYFIDEKIPSEQRDKIPLLADGNQIVWIVGYRMSAAYKVTKDTRRIIKVTVS